MLRKLLIIALALSGLIARATDTLVLENGDKLSGTFVSQQDGFITFDSPLLGTITVSESKANVVMGDGPTVEDAAAEANQILASGAASEDTTAEDEPDSAAEAKENQEDIDAVTKSLNNAEDWIQRNKPQGWTGKLSFGLTFIETDSESMAINFGFNGKKSSAPHHYSFNLFYQYNKQTDANGIETKNLDKYGANIGYDFDINEWMFLNSDLGYLRNQVKDIRHEVNLDLGIGFRIINEDDMKLNVIPAYTLQYKDALGVSQKWYNLATIKEDFTYQFSEIVRFEQNASASIAPADTSQYQYMASAALISKLADWIDASITYQLTFDNTVGTGGYKREQQLIFALGVPY
ncbi:MAG: DUF481 domain-containing protein [Puniceicoccales bacterium]